MFAAALLTISLSATAQTVKKETADFLMTGKITAIELTAKTVSLEGANGESGTFVVNDATTIMSGNAKIKLADLQKGSRVALNGDNPRREEDRDLHRGRRRPGHQEVAARRRRR